MKPKFTIEDKIRICEEGVFMTRAELAKKYNTTEWSIKAIHYPKSPEEVKIVQKKYRESEHGRKKIQDIKKIYRKTDAAKKKEKDRYNRKKSRKLLEKDS